ncbi:MAG: pyrroline-5-carboxylate reductase [Gammaproteobacteria bacterium]|nr:pyrroline-5-carboxylate reductase [Gammaproteobacteria bacterium]
MNQQRLCFIGGGNMATSLIGGLLANDYDASNIIVCDIDETKLAGLSCQFGIATTNDGGAAVASADSVILAVKPQIMQLACEQLANSGSIPECLFISIAAGIRESAIDRWLGGNRAVVRCMPNTPALVQLGATGLYANPRVSEVQKMAAQNILDAVGITIWVEQESALDAVTAISGSGPAYFFYFIELLQQAGEDLGLSEETARLLAKRTALGAASMAQEGDVVQLRAQVTSRGGTTEQAILSFQKNGLASLLKKATKAAHDRSEELARELENPL